MGVGPWANFTCSRLPSAFIFACSKLSYGVTSPDTLSLRPARCRVRGTSRLSSSFDAAAQCYRLLSATWLRSDFAVDSSRRRAKLDLREYARAIAAASLELLPPARPAAKNETRPTSKSKESFCP
ncbi:hypothetical protein GOP47_0015579 [Adiantum capillus-veneris]|uniref:Uncharacterized protein n=1 Tax=Adiantum capillus-veneris TaxID=13818 RepID=A0A9D4ZBC9_ADICA|nr:hypothetical protein GOP47_0015579 [Adiantum capillus-veneris]